VFDIRKRQKTHTEKNDPGPLPSSSSPGHPTTAVDSGPTTPVDGSAPQTAATVEALAEEERISKQGPTTHEWTVKSPAVASSIEQTSLNATETSDPSHSTGAPDVDSLASLVSATTIQEQSQAAVPSEARTESPLRRSRASSQKEPVTSSTASPRREDLDGRLRLQTLELERVSLSVAVLQRAFDWSVLSNLTILDCPQHDRLWVMLRRQFVPTPLGPCHSSAKHGATTSLQYHLNLKKIHTDAASPALISFLKETLAPNTLETLFLQDRRRATNSNVTIVSYRAPPMLVLFRH